MTGLKDTIHVLVAAATKHGSTMEIAEAIGRTLAEQGLATTVTAVDRVSDIDSYQAAVIGSGVYMGHWLEPARTFVDHCGEALKTRPTWLFSSGPIGEPPRPKADEAVDVRELMAATGARDHRLFDGKIDKQRLGFAERAVVRAVGASEGDFRDWDAIHEWARGIARDLATGVPACAAPMRPS